MDWTNIDESVLFGENNTELTKVQEQYIDVKNKLNDIEKQLSDVNVTLCRIVSKINNVIYVLNLLDPTIQL